MASTKFDPSLGLQSNDHRDLRNVIDELRSKGISHYVDFPLHVRGLITSKIGTADRVLKIVSASTTSLTPNIAHLGAVVKLKVPQNRRHHESDPEMEKNDLDSNMKDLIPMVGRICTNVSHGKDIEGDRLEDAATFQDYRKGLAVDDGLDYVRNACR
ncbi:hypothetical protein LTR13_008204 [Exophiala sideris]|nr:hypothetical protein LTR13_008204 [Exophiala sideris]KAK5176416.1 hypothetical protein LTR44_011038 [Eurotiomycetes sp. CCFEE 6388]